MRDYVWQNYPIVAAKGEGEPERKETRSKVEDDRKHEYPLYSCFTVNFIQFYSGCYVVHLLRNVM